MLPNFGLTKSPGGSSHEIGETGQRRWEDPPQRIGGPDLGIHPSGPSGVLRLIDTRRGSPKGHYVNHVADALMKATGDSIGVADSS